MNENAKSPETASTEPPKKILDAAPKSFIRIVQEAGGRDFFLVETMDKVQRALDAAKPDEFVPFTSIEVFLVDPEKRFDGLEVIKTQVSHRAKYVVAIGEISPIGWKSLIQRSVPPEQPPATPPYPPGIVMPPT